MKLRTPLLIALGAGIAYIAGTAEGREKFNALIESAKKIAGDAGLDEFAHHVGERGVEVAQGATRAATDAVDAASDKAKDALDSAAHNASDATTKAPESTS